MIDELYQLLKERQRQAPAGSYTAELLSAGTEGILRKIHEETLEMTLAAVSESRGRLVEETADVFYHLLVLLVSEEIDLERVWEELRSRRRGWGAGNGEGSP